jgi:hypothetical protein
MPLGSYDRETVWREIFGINPPAASLDAGFYYRQAKAAAAPLLPSYQGVRSFHSLTPGELFAPLGTGKTESVRHNKRGSPFIQPLFCVPARVGRILF